MSDKLIRDLLIKVKQSGASQTTKSLEAIVVALKNATSEAHAVKDSLGKVTTTLRMVQSDADKVASSLNNMASSNKLIQLNTSIKGVSIACAEMSTSVVAEVSKVNNAFSTMEASINSSMRNASTATSKLTTNLRLLTTTASNSSSSLNTLGSSLSKIKVTSALGNISGDLTRIDPLAIKAAQSLNRLGSNTALIGLSTALRNLVTLLRSMPSSMSSSSSSINAALAGIAAAIKTSATAAKKANSEIQASATRLNAPYTKLSRTLTGTNSKLTEMATKGTAIHASLIELPVLLGRIQAAAERAASSMNRINPPGAFKNLNKTLNTLVEKLDEVIIAVIEMSDRTKNGFDDMVRASRRSTDEIVRGGERIEDQLRDIRRASDRAGGGLDDLGRRGDRMNRILGNNNGATRMFASLSKLTGPITMAFGLIAANVYALTAAFNQMKVGDQLNRLEQFGSVVGSISGTPVQTLAIALQEATQYAVSYENAMKQASMASAYGFDSKQISEFALVARRASATLGIDMTDALNRVIKGVSKQEIELLDELGVTIRLNEAFQVYVDKLNAANTGITYNIQSLSSYQKQQAYAQAVVAESTKKFGHLDQVLRATPWELFGANAESALRRFQQAAATYLTPTVDWINTIFYQTISGRSAEAAKAQRMSIRLMDANNPSAVLNNLNSTNEGAKKAVEERSATAKQLASLNEEIAKREAADNWIGRIRTEARYQGPIGKFFEDTFMGADLDRAFADMGFNRDFLQYDKWKDETVAMKNQSQKLYKETSDSDKKSIQEWADTRNAALAKVAKENPKLAEKLEIRMGVDGTYYYNDKVAEGLLEQSKAYEELKRTSSDASANIQNFAINSSNAAKATAAANSALVAINDSNAAGLGDKDKLTKELNIGFDTFDQLEAFKNASKEYNDLLVKESQVKRDIQKAIADAGKSEGGKKAGKEAGEAIALKYEQDKLIALKKVQDTNKDNIALRNAVLDQETSLLTIQNSQLENAKTIKDTTAKTLGIDREIALLNNRTMTDSQFRLANLNNELDIEKDKYAYLSKQKDKLKETEESRRAIANIEREIWQYRKDQQASTVQGRVSSLGLSQTSRNIAGENQKLQEQIDLYENIHSVYSASESDMAKYTAQVEAASAALDKLKSTNANAGDIAAAEAKKAAAVDGLTAASGNDAIRADANQQLASLKAQQEQLEKQREAAKKQSVIGAIGGNWSPTEGLEGADLQQANWENQLNNYQEAISKLNELDSVSTGVAQSLGNLALAATDFGKGSLDGLSLMSTGMQAIGQMVAYTSNQQVGAIDKAIAAEQARDGKSEESKNKIKKLEEQKVKAQQAAAKKQIIISTAVAMMNAAATSPFLPLGLTMMATAAAAGALSLAAASSATAVPSVSDNSTSYLKMGERQKTVDLAQSSSAGESAYVRGDRGVGTSSTFIPRAAGGMTYPGVNYKFGEKGMEVGTPMVPTKITPNDKVVGKPDKSNKPPMQVNIHAIDASSFRDFALSNPEAFRDAVELALSSEGTTLKTLGN